MPNISASLRRLARGRWLILLAASAACSDDEPKSNADASAASPADANVSDGTTPSPVGDAGDASAWSAADALVGPNTGDTGAASTCTKRPVSSTDCKAPLAPGDERVCMIGDRKYLLYAPPNYDPCAATALVVDAHGATQTAEEQAAVDPDNEFCAVPLGPCFALHGAGSGWRVLARSNQGGFIIATPQGNLNLWSESDADFMLQVVDAVKGVADIDEKKVYMSGISNGAGLTYWTGCPHSDVFSGLAPLAGGANCTSIAKPISVIQFNGKPDFAYDAGVAAVENMAKLNHCKTGPTPWLTIDSSYDEEVCYEFQGDNTVGISCAKTKTPIAPTACRMWSDCDDGVEVVFCDVDAANEHGAGNEAIDAHILYENDSQLALATVAWRFFQRHH